jgi:hypothetical protein
MIESAEPATIMSMSENSSAWNVGLSIHFPSTRPTRTPAIGPFHGILLALSANDVGDEAEDVVVVLLVGGEDVDDDLHLVLEAFREERPDGAVDDPAGEDLLIARTPLALDEAAGDLARRVGLLLVLDGEREEGQRALLLADGDGGEEDGLPVGDERGPGGLLGHAPGLDDEGAAGEGPLNAMHHAVLSLDCARSARSASVRSRARVGGGA